MEGNHKTVIFKDVHSTFHCALVLKVANIPTLYYIQT